MSILHSCDLNAGNDLREHDQSVHNPLKGGYSDRIHMNSAITEKAHIPLYLGRQLPFAPLARGKAGWNPPSKVHASVSSRGPLRAKVSKADSP